MNLLPAAWIINNVLQKQSTFFTGRKVIGYSPGTLVDGRGVWWEVAKAVQAWQFTSAPSLSDQFTRSHDQQPRSHAACHQRGVPLRELSAPAELPHLPLPLVHGFLLMPFSLRLVP